MREELFEIANSARLKASAPYSEFLVGAVLLAKSGKVYSGCNIESASYGLTVCAERVALLKAVSEGEREFEELWIVVDTEKLTPPCGACRQVIWEYCGDIKIVLANLSGSKKVYRMSQLLPEPFDGNILNS